MGKYVQPILGANEVGVKVITVSFLANGAADPASSSFQGDGLVAVSGPTVTGTTGKYLLTFDQAWARIESATVDIDADATGDGAYATCVQLSTGDPLTFTVYTHAAGGTKTNYSARRIALSLIVKDSIVNTGLV